MGIELIELIKAETLEEALSNSQHRAGELFVVKQVNVKPNGIGFFEVVATMEKTCSDAEIRSKADNLIDAAKRVVDLHENSKLGERGESLSIQLLRERIQKF